MFIDAAALATLPRSRGLPAATVGGPNGLSCKPPIQVRAMVGDARAELDERRPTTLASPMSECGRAAQHQQRGITREIELVVVEHLSCLHVPFPKTSMPTACQTADCAPRSVANPSPGHRRRHRAADGAPCVRHWRANLPHEPVRHRRSPVPQQVSQPVRAGTRRRRRVRHHSPPQIVPPNIRQPRQPRRRREVCARGPTRQWPTRVDREHLVIPIHPRPGAHDHKRRVRKVMRPPPGLCLRQRHAPILEVDMLPTSSC